MISCCVAKQKTDTDINPVSMFFDTLKKMRHFRKGMLFL